MPNTSTITLELIRADLDRMRLQVSRHRREIVRLRSVGLSVAPAEALVQKMQAEIEEMCVKRDKLRKNMPHPTKGRTGHRKL